LCQWADTVLHARALSDEDDFRMCGLVAAVRHVAWRWLFGDRTIPSAAHGVNPFEPPAFSTLSGTCCSFWLSPNFSFAEITRIEKVSSSLGIPQLLPAFDSGVAG